jgi:hypothetical protein
VQDGSRLGGPVALLGLLPGDGLDVAAAIAEGQLQERLTVLLLPKLPLAHREHGLDPLSAAELAQAGTPVFIELGVECGLLIHLQLKVEMGADEARTIG